MPRRRINTHISGPFHVTARSINQEWFLIPMEEVWAIFSDHLYLLAHGFGIEIHSFVLMSNHYHLIVSTPNGNLSEGMCYFHREVSKHLNGASHRINRTFAGRYFKCHLGSYHYFLNCYKYVYQNPLRKNMVRRVEEYPFSTLGGKLGLRHLPVPVVADDLLFGGDLGGTLHWLNQLPKEEDLSALRAALRKAEFKLRKDKRTNRPHALEAELF